MSTVKDKTKDGKVHWIVESEVRVGGMECIVCLKGCPPAVWWIDRKYLGYWIMWPVEEAGLPVVQQVGQGGGGRGGIRRRKWRMLCIEGGFHCQPEKGGGQGKEFQVKEFQRQCQTNNLVNM